MMPGLLTASRICCWWCQRSVNSRAVSNQLADFSSPAQLAPYGASERRSSISIPSIFGKRCAVRMGFNGSIRRFIKCSTSEIKTVAENHLGNQVIRRTRHTHTEAKIDFPLGGEIQVNGGEDLLLLLADRVEARDRTQRDVIFDSSRDFFGEIVA